MDIRLSLGRPEDVSFESSKSPGVNDSRHDNLLMAIDEDFPLLVASVTLKVLSLNLVEARGELLGGFEGLFENIEFYS